MSKISIDLGTSNTQIACLDTNGQPKNIGGIIPTVLYVDSEANRIHVGQAAVYAYENALHAKKENASSYYLENFKPELCQAQVTPDDLTVLTGVDGKLMTWLQVLTACFSYFRRFAMENEFAGAEVNEIVLTHPVDFPNIELYRQAALNAGFKTVDFVQEPEAAYHGYKVGGRNLGNKVLVFDMGGGTLDVALLEQVNGAWSVRNQPLRLDTAGCHIDWAICESLQNELSEAGLLSNSDDVASFIKYAREQIKEPLGSGVLDAARIRYMSDVTDGRLKGTYTRERFYRVLDGLLVPVFRTIKSYVNGLPQSPDTVLMVGGSSRLSYVKDKLEKLFSGIKVFSPADGGSLVAKGAMLVATAPPVVPIISAPDDQSRVEPTRPDLDVRLFMKF